MERVEKLMQSWPQFSQSGSRKKNEHVAAILAPFQEVEKKLKNADANLASF